MPPSIACITKPEPFEVSTCPDEPGELKPVPPYPAATAVPCHTPVPIVPILVKFDKVSIAASKVASVVASIASTF